MLRILLLWALVQGTSGWLAAQGSEAASVEPDLGQGAAVSDKELEAIEALVREHAERGLQNQSAVGLGIAVGWRGTLAYEGGFGLAELEHQVPVQAETLFRIGSITKQFTAAYVLQQVEAGRLKLDAPINDRVEFPFGEHKVTLRQLLNHTSGIPSYTDQRAEWFPLIPLDLEHEQLLGIVAGEPFEFEPGTGWKYNNSGYYMLGVLLEGLRGKSYAHLIQRELIKPLGLEVRYDSHLRVIPNRAQGYSADFFGLINDRSFGIGQAGAAGGLIANAGDLVRWTQLLASGQVVSKDSYALMIQATELANGNRTPYGFGLGVLGKNGRPRISHGGGIFGFNSMLSHYPDAGAGPEEAGDPAGGGGLVVCVLSNSEGGNSGGVEAALAKDLLELLAPN